MKKAEAVRRSVSEAYAQAVRRPAARAGRKAVQKGVVAKLGGYSARELAKMPAAAVENSFGCGNPVALAGLRKGDVVLDLGSGAGIDLFLAAKRVGPKGRAIGVDMTDAMLRKARANIRAGGYTNVEVRKGIIEKLPVDDASVDWVISNCVINLSPEKERVFREIARVLRPGGQMLVSDIVAEKLPAAVKRSAAFYNSCVAGAISEKAYLAGLRKAGLEGAEVRARLVYDADQLEAFAASELEGASCCGAGEGGCCGGGGEGCRGGKLDARTRKAVRSMTGKVWSAKIHARKPAGKAAR